MSRTEENLEGQKSERSLEKPELRSGPVRILCLVEPDACLEIKHAPAPSGVDLKVVDTVEEALKFELPETAIIDDAFTQKNDALSFLSSLRKQGVFTVVTTSQFTGEHLTALEKLGVDMVVAKPLDVYRISVLARVERTEAAQGSNFQRPAPIVGSNSILMQEVWRRVVMAAQTPHAVIVGGETGVGKELVARTIHRFSARRYAPFVAVNCAAIPETLLESELFGHEKGSFTGALSRHAGRFELADGGTLFLDEIGDLPLSLQVKLLRVLQEQQFERVGGTTSIRVDVRVIAATHRSIEALVESGQFRSDLYYRLNVVSIQLPPIRERKDEILELWQHFLKKDGPDTPQPTRLTTSLSAQRFLLQYSWPGNIREIANAAAHAQATVAGGIVMPADLPDALTCKDAAVIQRPSLAGLTLDTIEQMAIVDAYQATGSVRGAAQMLNVAERTLHYRLREYEQKGRASDVFHRKNHTPKENVETAHKPCIMIADDDDDIREALTEFLESEGCLVIAERDGRSVLARLDSSRTLKGEPSIDFILTDMRMPGLNGLCVLESVINEGRNIPVIVMSAFGDATSREAAQNMGALDFLGKPIDLARLKALIRPPLPS